MENYREEDLDPEEKRRREEEDRKREAARLAKDRVEMVLTCFYHAFTMCSTRIYLVLIMSCHLFSRLTMLSSGFKHLKVEPFSL